MSKDKPKSAKKISSLEKTIKQDKMLIAYYVNVLMAFGK